MEFVPMLLIVFLVIPLVFLPTIIAVKKNHPHKTPIIIVNLAGMWMLGIGWLIALVWCFIEPGKMANVTTVNVASEIEKLNELKENGVLSEAEFEKKKTELLA